MLARIQLALAAGLLCLAAVLGVVLLAGTRESQAVELGPEGFAGAVRPAVPPQDFTLRDQDGERVSLDAYRGRPVVLSFIYSTCDDTCPILASQIRSALDEIGDDDDPPVLLVSVDPQDDTALNARRFLLEQRLTGRARFLLGSKAELEPVWRGYGIQPQERGEDAFDHSSYVLLVDAEGRQRTSFPLNQLTVPGLVHDVRALARER